jgi:hypothetical protein
VVDLAGQVGCGVVELREIKIGHDGHGASNVEWPATTTGACWARLGGADSAGKLVRDMPHWYAWCSHIGHRRSYCPTVARLRGTYRGDGESV